MQIKYMNFSNVKEWTINEGSVIRVTDSLNRVIWEKNSIPSEPSLDPDRATQYFYVEDITGNANTVTIKKRTSDAPTVVVYYSTDQTNWTSMGGTSTSGITATVPANGRLYLKATTDAWRYQYLYDWNTVDFGGYANIGGNIMSLLYGDNFQNQTVLNQPYTFGELFSDNTNLCWITNLVMPATTLTNYCYICMFQNCTNLRNGDNGNYYDRLPAATLTHGCYEAMFNGCTSMENPMAMPFRNVVMAYSSCMSMYQGCTSLQHGGIFNSYTLAPNCMEFMFKGCTTFTRPYLPADSTLVSNCYNSMFEDCTGITWAYLRDTDTVLVEGCYANMFKGCTSLNRIKCYAQDISASGCLNNWLSGVSATGDFYNNGAATFPTGASGIPSGWTVHT